MKSTRERPAHPRRSHRAATSFRIGLTDDYLQLIAQVGEMPRDQNGADKSYVWRAEQAFKATFRNVRLVERQP